jgi:hypothetical protein
MSTSGAKIDVSVICKGGVRGYISFNFDVVFFLKISIGKSHSYKYTALRYNYNRF